MSRKRSLTVAEWGAIAHDVKVAHSRLQSAFLKLGPTMPVAKVTGFMRLVDQVWDRQLALENLAISQHPEAEAELMRIFNGPLEGEE